MRRSSSRSQSSDAKHAVELAASDFAQAAAPHLRRVRARAATRPTGRRPAAPATFAALRVHAGSRRVPRGDPGLRGDAPAARRGCARRARVRGRPAQERAWHSCSCSTCRSRCRRVRRAATQTAAVPFELRPTHVVLGSRAHRIGGAPLTLGSAVPGDRRALPLEPGPGISRSHCTLSGEGGAVWLDDHSTYGTLRERRARHRSRRVARRRSPARRQPGRRMRACARGGRRWHAVRSRSSASRSWT